MRCPKCHYVSFDGQTRCRNCGYDLSLAQPSDPVDVNTRAGHTSATPLADLSLKPDPPPAGSSSAIPDTFDPPFGGGGTGGSSAGPSGSLGGTARARAQAPDSAPLDLPLFGAGGGCDASSVRDRGERSERAERAERDDRADRPLINPSTPPRPPLAVRRPTGDVPRARPRVTPAPQLPIADEPRLDLDLPDRSLDASSSSSFAPLPLDEPIVDDDIDPDRVDNGRDVAREAIAETPRAFETSNAAPLGLRAAAALIDLAFLAAVDATVLYFTLRLTGLSLDGVNRLPLTPFLGFLSLLNGGYLAMFTAASGQTMGKMVMGVKVVSVRGDGEAVPFGQAVLRAILWLLTIVPLGVGAIPALLTDDRRALHDRLAETRVIKVE